MSAPIEDHLRALARAREIRRLYRTFPVDYADMELWKAERWVAASRDAAHTEAAFMYSAMTGEGCDA